MIVIALVVFIFIFVLIFSVLSIRKNIKTSKDCSDAYVVYTLTEVESELPAPAEESGEEAAPAEESGEEAAPAEESGEEAAPATTLIGGCAGTLHGCCSDGVTSKQDAEGSNCQPASEQNST